MTRVKFFLLCLGACFALASAQAREGNTYQDELRIYTADIALQCKSVQQQLESFKMRSDPLTGYNLKDAVQSLCHCLPEKTQAFRATLTPEELARPVSAEEYTARFNPAVIDQCASEQMHAMYGEQCPKRFRGFVHDVKAYCACMKDVVDGYPADTAASISAAAADYLPQAAEAEKNGQPAPARPPVLAAYSLADQRCKGK